MPDEPRKVVVEVRRADTWHPIGSLSEDEPAGSISAQKDGVREVYIFGWRDNEGPAVWRSKAGFDVANAAVRTITSTGLELVADLTQEPLEIEGAGSSGLLSVRFRLEA